MKTMMRAACFLLVMGVSEYMMADACCNTFWEDVRTKEIPNPEKTARRQTDEMDRVLNLTEKQYKKIYKLYLKEEREKLKLKFGGKPMGREGEHPMPPMDGGYPQMGGGQSGELGPALMGGRPPMLPQAHEAKHFEEEAERLKKIEKKLRKILTEEQYAVWLTMKPEPPVPGKDKPVFSNTEDL